MNCHACNTHLYDEFVIRETNAMVDGTVALCLDCELFADTVDLNTDDGLFELSLIARGIL